MKTPTLKQKVEMYERFLHKINMYVICCNNEGIAELVKNADAWSYAHRVGNGEISDRRQQQLINTKFWNLCKTWREESMNNKLVSKIYHKDVWGFLFFKRYSLYVEDEEQNLTEILVDKETWSKYSIGDIYVP